MDRLCRVLLLGGLRVEQGARIITRFRTQKTGALLAYLAYHRQKRHAREVLIELLWPECDLEAGRNSLSVALSSLRHQLEPPGVPAGALIIADRTTVGLNPATVRTDVAEFEAALEAAAASGRAIERIPHLTDAVERYQGELLPGYYEEWILPEQRRLTALYSQTLEQLVRLLEQSGDLARALQVATRAVSIDPLREEAHQTLMRLYVSAGQPAQALRQYRELEQILRDELGQMPLLTSRLLADEIERHGEPGMARPDQMVAAFSQTAAHSGSALHSVSPLPPAGTVTFLLTAIQCSSAPWARPDQAARAALAHPRTLLRREFHRHGGHEITEADDSFVVAFAAAGDALACAVAAQRALAAETWPAEVGTPQARMALHTGDVERTTGKRLSRVLDYASRLLMASHGDQILCSEATAGLLRSGRLDRIEGGVRLADLGAYRVRGMPAPGRIFQVEYPEMKQRVFPPPQAEAAAAGGLPPQLNHFFGREGELGRLRELLIAENARLVTLTGPGGSGKTRLALAAAGQLMQALQGAVWFVPLADLTDARLIPVVVRDALRLPATPHLTPLGQVVDALAHQPALLILDNFEQLVTEGAVVLRDLLDQTPTLQCLVTSRQRLGLEGEQEIPVLPLPTPTGTLSPERLTLYESVQLFVDRAQSVRPDFQVTDQNAPAVAELCQRLEGIPLAIELAAARAQVLTPSQMLVQLERRFDFLVSRRRDAAARHRTLRTAIDWSFQLIAPDLQRFFARLSVFRGGWTLTAAEMVCGEPLALDYLAQLCECSLILAEEGPFGMRFRMLETLREFASDQLNPEQQLLLKRRHLDYCLQIATAAAEKETEWGERQWRDRLEPEQENVHAALERGLTTEPHLALRLAGEWAVFWLQSHRYAEGSEWLERALAQAPEAPPAVRARALFRAGLLARIPGEFQKARALLDEALELYRTVGDRHGQADVMYQQSWLPIDPADRDQRLAMLRQCLAIYQEIGHEWGIAWSLYSLGNAEQALTILRRIGPRWAVGMMLNNTALVLSNQGKDTEARALLEEALQTMRERGDNFDQRYPLINLGRIACRQGALDEATRHLREALQLCRKLGDKRLIVECLEGLANVAVAQGRWSRAARLLAAGEAVREVIGWPLDEHLRPERDRQILTLRSALGEEAYAAACYSSRSLNWQQAAEVGLENNCDRDSLSSGRQI